MIDRSLVWAEFGWTQSSFWSLKVVTKRFSHPSTFLITSWQCTPEDIHESILDRLTPARCVRLQFFIGRVRYHKFFHGPTPLPMAIRCFFNCHCTDWSFAVLFAQ